MQHHFYTTDRVSPDMETTINYIVSLECGVLVSQSDTTFTISLCEKHQDPILRFPPQTSSVHGRLARSLASLCSSYLTKSHNTKSQNRAVTEQEKALQVAGCECVGGFFLLQNFSKRQTESVIPFTF